MASAARTGSHVQSQGGNVNLALLLHHLDLLRIPVDLTDCNRPWYRPRRCCSPGAPCASRPSHGWGREYQTMLAHELELEQLQQGSCCRPCAPSPCFAATAATCFTIYRYWVPQQGPQRSHMLSYRHAFHAGNHADVLKHAVQALIIESLKKKENPSSCWTPMPVAVSTTCAATGRRRRRSMPTA